MKGRACVCAWVLLMIGAAQAQESRALDGFDDPGAWRIMASNQVSGSLRTVDGVRGPGLCLDYDFNGVSGYVGLQRDVSIDYPDNYRFDFMLRGDSPRNDLQFKLIDASGDNVWWVNRPGYEFPRDWTPVRYKRRHVSKAWGPDADPVLRHSARLEFTLNNNVGGKGEVCFDELSFTLLPLEPQTAYAPVASVVDTDKGGATVAGYDAGNAVDDSRTTALVWNTAQASRHPLQLDLGQTREFGGLTLAWTEDFASGYEIAVSDDAKTWRTAKTVTHGNGGNDWIAMQESEARYIRLRPLSASGKRIGLEDVRVQPLGFAATPNDFLKSVAAGSPRGAYPRGFVGEQPYWTIVGLDGGHEQGLIGEDGAIEIGKGQPSVAPLVQVDGGALLTWADVQVSQSLQDGYLPIPSVAWKHAAFDLGITAFVQGQARDSQLVARYRLTNTDDKPHEYVLVLALQPWQVNPPSQFLNTTGGFSPIDRLTVTQASMDIGGGRRLFAAQPADAVLATEFEAGLPAERLASGYLQAPATWVRQATATSSDGLAAGAWLYPIRLEPGESEELAWVAPLQGEFASAEGFDVQAAQQSVAAIWRDKLDQVQFQVPDEGRALVDILRTATSHMLISRIGPRLQPGTRSYARSWIRDGAMISEGLLRMGRPEVVKEYLEFYAPYQFDNGKVPCCVDDRGSDPVPENDSHGELIYNVAEYWRYSGDREFLRRMWTHVRGAFDYMEVLRASERTEAVRKENPAFFGMMPASISHEGYSAKPMHSYWDDFWALRGYKDAVEIAQALGETQQAARMATARDQFADDLQASLRAAMELHGIDYLPGAAELGDFDPTSTTIALAPGGEQARLPAAALNGTFERYWREFVERRDGLREWKDYTPYEWRNVAAFVRLGWRERAWEAIRFFFDDRTPQAWNQWGEVVSRTPREPFFLGDLPHAWVGSDFLRSALDMFAYGRESDDSLVLAAGIPARWLDGDGVAITGLRTPSGTLGYSLRREGGELRLQIDPGSGAPAGGLVLPWPYAGQPGAASIDGQPAKFRNGELVIPAGARSIVVDVR
ncbi:coagulation factor 5/8 type domain-containing protein [Pseudoxanthomonas kalamensis DSM 18571]|nr:coagulation factor 5/8 type domain-containing protein [Pseudoxanthomonas kalamensis DSM 18571]